MASNPSRSRQTPAAQGEAAANLQSFGLHCLRKAGSDMAVIFVHGLLSDGENAWGYPSWPQLLRDEPDFGASGIYIFTYQTGLASGTYSISDVANVLREYLILNDLLDLKKVVFVCHSMGGIAVRRFIVANRDRLADKNLVLGLFLVASPSRGSRTANLVSLLTHVLQHTQGAALRFAQTNVWLNDLHDDFSALLADGRVRIVGRELVEDKGIRVTRWLGMRRQLVEPIAAGVYFHQPGYEPLRVPGSNHITIVKPLHRNALQHQALLRFLRELPAPAAAAAAVAEHRPEPWINPIDDYATSGAVEVVSRLRTDFDKLLEVPEALASLNQAILATRRYLLGRKAGSQRDPEFEASLSDMWHEVGRLLQDKHPELAALCWVKSQGWADERVWEDPRFRDLPIGLDDLLERLREVMTKQAAGRQTEREAERRAIAAIHNNLERFETIRPTLSGLIDEPYSDAPHRVTQQLSHDGYVIEFSGYGETRTITADDLERLAPAEWRVIAASERAMDKLLDEWVKVDGKGLLDAADKKRLIEISAQMAERLGRIFDLIEKTMGGALQDHYAVQRNIAEKVVRLAREP